MRMIISQKTERKGRVLKI